MLLGQNKLTESIIETKQEYFDFDSVKPFEQFFIADLSEDIKKSKNGTPSRLKFRYLFDPENSMEETISNFLIENSGTVW